MPPQERYNYSKIDGKLAKEFVADPFTHIGEMQKAIGAYIAIQPETFVGFLYDPQGLGPETPYFFPQEKDLNFNTQVVARIGVQCKYWFLLAQALKNKSIHPLDWSLASAFALNFGDFVGVRVHEEGKGNMSRIREKYGGDRVFNT